MSTPYILFDEMLVSEVAGCSQGCPRLLLCFVCPKDMGYQAVYEGCYLLSSSFEWLGWGDRIGRTVGILIISSGKARY